MQAGGNERYFSLCCVTVDWLLFVEAQIIGSYTNNLKGFQQINYLREYKNVLFKKRSFETQSLSRMILSRPVSFAEWTNVLSTVKAIEEIFADENETGELKTVNLSL